MKAVPFLFVACSSLLAVPVFAADAPPAPPPPEVGFVVVKASQTPVVFSYSGVTAPSRIVEIRARVPGFIESRTFEEGALVKEGTPLFTIDARSFKSDLQIANAQVKQAETRVQLAGQELQRLQSVKVPGAVAQVEVDRQLAEQANAAASLSLAKAQRDKASLELSYTTVVAPLTGFIGKVEREIGSYVDAGAGSLLTEMQQVDPIYVSFQVSEREYLAWQQQRQAGQLVLAGVKDPWLEITLMDGSRYDKRGTINFESPAMDMKTGTVELRATFDNPENRIKPGQFIKAHVMGWVRPNVLTVPQAAVNQGAQGSYVYVLKDGNIAELRPITPGEWNGQSWIVEKGLQPGEKVLVEGLTRVMPGGPVNPHPVEAPPLQTPDAVSVPPAAP